METQVQPYIDSQEDPIQSFSPNLMQAQSRSLSVSQMGPQEVQQEITVNCECGVLVRCSFISWLDVRLTTTQLEDCDCVSCDSCNKWFHIWCVFPPSNTLALISAIRCMGYHSANAKNMPDQFVCFDCRVRADQNWDLIMVHNLHPRMMEKFRDLALFRYDSFCLNKQLTQRRIAGEPLKCLRTWVPRVCRLLLN